MAEFFENLFNSIFTPGPTPTLVVATNAAFAGLQLLLLALLAATRSVHFAILSVLSGGLWVAINWFVREIDTLKAQEAKEKAPEGNARGGPVASERKEPRSRPIIDQDQAQGDQPAVESEDTETEEGETRVTRASARKMEATSSSLKPQVDEARKRRSAGDVSGTDSEWEKLSESEIRH